MISSTCYCEVISLDLWLNLYYPLTTESVLNLPPLKNPSCKSTSVHPNLHWLYIVSEQFVFLKQHFIKTKEKEFLGVSIRVLQKAEPEAKPYALPLYQRMQWQGIGVRGPRTEAGKKAKPARGALLSCPPMGINAIKGSTVKDHLPGAFMNTGGGWRLVPWNTYHEG